MITDDEILFTESQRFSFWWLWLALIIPNCIVLFGIYKQVMLGQPFGNHPVSNTGLFLLEAMVLVICALVLSFRLDTQIRKDGVYVRFFPLQIKFRHYNWNVISKAYIRQYHPISEYGGWGIRFGLFSNGRALTVSGNKGLQLEFIDDRKLLIGTLKEIELAQTLAKINRLNA